MTVGERRDGHLMTITLDRPASLNALTQPMMRRLVGLLQSAAIDPDVHAVMLRGAGRAFCAGGDRKISREPDPDDPLAARWGQDPAWFSPEMHFDRLRANVRAVELLRGMAKPNVAMIRGPAVGAGFGLAAACDFRIVSDTACFRAGFVAAGYSGDFGLAYSLVRLVGGAKARELILLDRPIPAEEAHRLGLVTAIVPDAELEAEAEAFARRFVGGPGVAYRCAKANIEAAETLAFAAALDVETRNMVRTSASADAAEARAAFAEHRPPSFTGR
jgi:2-(1,2-epoxy-1,2-dihydrophenyl)acetyl-CoA isomerase